MSRPGPLLTLTRTAPSNAYLPTQRVSLNAYVVGWGYTRMPAHGARPTLPVPGQLPDAVADPTPPGGAPVCPRTGATGMKPDTTMKEHAP